MGSSVEYLNRICQVSFNAFTRDFDVTLQQQPTLSVSQGSRILITCPLIVWVR